MGEKRTPHFMRNQKLELMLSEINNDLTQAELELPQGAKLGFPIIFVMGALRSGTTLMMQWLANLGTIAYPTNLLSRFYGAPIIGSKIQLLLTDERFNFRNEILDFKSPVNYESENGKTKGALAPNEFWYFWRRFLPFEHLDYMSSDELMQKVDIRTLIGELAGIMDVFQKPFAMKGNILNYNIDFLNELFEKAIFIHTRRDPLTNIESALKARERQLGTIDAWYSFKIPEYPELIKLDPYDQVAGQIYYNNKAVEKGLEKVAEHKRIFVQYENFCTNPKKTYEELVVKLAVNGCQIDNEYPLKEKFEVTRKNVQDRRILKAYEKFFK
jgi:hypothetical protein